MKEKQNLHYELAIASAAGNIQKATILLNSGADVNWIIPGDYTTLEFTAINADYPSVAKLFRIKDNVSLDDLSQYTALHLAAARGHDDLVKLLLSRNAAVDVKDRNHHTALQLAAYNGHTIAAKTLLDYGADVNVKGLGEYTALHLAAARGHDDLVKLLLSRNAAVDEIDQNGDTALHVAACNGHTIAAKTLLDYGATVYKKNIIVIVKALMDSGADFSLLKTTEGETCLDLAKKEGDEYYSGIIYYIAKAIMNQDKNAPNILACAMAKHTRLGAASNLNQINNDILEKILNQAYPARTNPSHIPKIHRPFIINNLKILITEEKRKKLAEVGDKSEESLPAIGMSYQRESGASTELVKDSTMSCVSTAADLIGDLLKGINMLTTNSQSLKTERIVAERRPPQEDGCRSL